MKVYIVYGNHYQASGKSDLLIVVDSVYFEERSALQRVKEIKRGGYIEKVVK